MPAHLVFRYRIPARASNREKSMLQASLRETLQNAAISDTIKDDGYHVVGEFSTVSDRTAFFPKLEQVSPLYSYSPCTAVPLDSIEVVAAAAVESIRSVELVESKEQDFDNICLMTTGNHASCPLNLQDLHNGVKKAVTEATGRPCVRKKKMDKDGKSQILTIDVGNQAAYISTQIIAGPGLRGEQKKLEYESTRSSIPMFQVKMGELYLMKGNQSLMIRHFTQNLKTKMGDMARSVKRDGFMLVVHPSKDVAESPVKLSQLLETIICVPGVHSVIPSSQPRSEYSELEKEVIGHLEKENIHEKLLDDKSESKGPEKRIGVIITMDKSNRVFDSKKKEEQLKYPLKCAVESKFPGVKCSFSKHQKSQPAYLATVNVRITSQNIYVSAKPPVEAVGGQPTGRGRETTRVVSLLSGGMDSPVASYMMCKRGCSVVLAHFQNVMIKDQANVKDKISRLSEVLSKYQVKTLLYIVPFNKIQEEIIDKVPAEDRMLVYRYFMMAIASRIAGQHKAKFLVTGDSMNQVSSQTSSNLEAMHKLSPKPILSPLIGMNKDEIMDIARQIGTYDISALPYGDCCSFFIAEHPNLSISSYRLRELVDRIEPMVWKGALLDAQIVNIRNPGDVKEVQKMYSKRGEPSPGGEQNGDDVCPLERPMKPDVKTAESDEIKEFKTADGTHDIGVGGEPEVVLDTLLENEIVNEPHVRIVSEPEDRIVDEPREGFGRLKIVSVSFDDGECAVAETSERVAPDLGKQEDEKKTGTTFSDFIDAEMESGTKNIAYLDNAATTQMHKEVIEAMFTYMTKYYGNPHSLHAMGKIGIQAVEAARAAIAESIGAKHSEIYFTSGGTESNNLSIKGVCARARAARSHKLTLNVITSPIEHDSVLEVCQSLVKPVANNKKPYEVRLVNIDRDGRVDLKHLASLIDQNTVLVSVMHANNEVGVLQPINEIGSICREKNVLFHTDACQSYTKVPVSVENIDLMTLNAHKIHGPKGVGALYVRNGTQMNTTQHGGHQESNMRSGTVNVPGVVGFHKAAEISLSDLHKNAYSQARSLRNYLWTQIKKIFKFAELNGPDVHDDSRIWNNISVRLDEEITDGEAVVNFLNKRFGICCSTGSACSSNDKNEPSRVIIKLQEAQLHDKLSSYKQDDRKKHASGTLRFTVSKYTTKEDVDRTIEGLNAYNLHRLQYRNRNVST